MSRLSIAAYFPFCRVKVVGQSVRDNARSALIHLEPDLRYRPVCHACGRPGVTVHSDGYCRIVRDLNLASAETWLKVRYRKVWCEHCAGARVEQLEFCDASQRITHRLARYIYELCKMLTVEDVARHLKLNPKTVKAVDRLFLDQEFGRTDWGDLRFLAIDEIALKKGQTYMTVVVDYLTGRVVWMGEGRNKETLDKFFSGMPQQQKALIEAVAMDMWDPYINRVRHHCPEAKIVFDFFHVVSAFGFVVDEIRRSEYRKAHREDKKVIKGSRFLLLRNASNLSGPQRLRLRDLLRLNRTLSAVYILKEQLKEVYRHHDRLRTKRALDSWRDMAAKIEHPEMSAFIRRLKRHEYGILNHCDFPIGTSHLEGINNKIKLIKRKAYGFHDPEYFALKIKQAFPGKQITNYLG